MKRMYKKRMKKNTLVLVLNCGGSSIKYKLLNIDNQTVIAEGNVQILGSSRGHVSFKVPKHETDY